MARAKPATQRGLNMEPSVTLEARLNRLYGKIDRAALQMLRRELPAVLAANDPTALGQFLERLQTAVDDALPDEEIRTGAARVAAAQDDTARNAFFPALAAAAGVKILGSDTVKKPPPPVAALRRAARRRAPTLVAKLNFAPEILSNQFVDQNVRLISTLRAGVADGVRDAVVRAKVLGSPDAGDLADRLLKSWQREGVPSQIPINRLTKSGERVLISAKKHARLIARDQMGSLNGQLARTRQTAAGIASFVWMPSTADNPRESHREFYGQTYTWADGADGIIPGEEINCQCSARAVVDKDQVLANGDFVEVGGDAFTERDISLLAPGPGALL